MAKPDLKTIRDTLEFMFSNEFKSLIDTIEKASKAKDDEQIKLAKAYGMGVQRAQDIINQVFNTAI